MPDINSLPLQTSAPAPPAAAAAAAASASDIQQQQPSNPPPTSTTLAGTNNTSAPHSHFRRTSSNFSSASSISAASPAPNRHPRPYNAAELHQELEREQEAVVNRLLHQIRNTAEAIHQSSSAIADELPTAVSPPSAMSLVYGPPSVTEMPSSLSPALGRARSPGLQQQHHSRHNSLSARSRTSSHTGSPLLQPTHLVDSSVWPHTSSDPFMMGGRDEVAFYKTETDMMIRENEMLKRRIRELEEQAAKMAGRTRATSTSTTASKQEDGQVSESG